MSKKDEKKKMKKIENVSSTENEEIMRLVKVLGGIVLVLVAFYFVFEIFSGNIKFGDDEETIPVEIQNVEILAGSTFLRDNNEYYVLMYDFGGNNAIYGSTVYSMYSQISTGYKMYLVDLGNMLNSSYVTDNVEEVNVSSIENMKVVDISLVKVKNGKAEFVKAGKDAVVKYQDELLK